MMNGIKNMRLKQSNDDDIQSMDDDELHEQIAFAKDQIINGVTSITTSQSLNDNTLKLKQIKTTNIIQTKLG